MTIPTGVKINKEAAEWLVRMFDTGFDPEEPYPDMGARQAAFVGWLRHSPKCVRAFLEIMEVHRRSSLIDAKRLLKITAAGAVITLDGSEVGTSGGGS